MIYNTIFKCNTIILPSSAELLILSLHHLRFHLHRPCPVIGCFLRPSLALLIVYQDLVLRYHLVVVLGQAVVPISLCEYGLFVEVRPLQVHFLKDP